MRIVVCMKQVPDTASRLDVRQGAVQPVNNGVEGMVNPFDEFALEAALQLRAVHGGEVEILSLAAGAVEETIFHGLAMGADSARVVTIPDGTFPGAIATAQILAEALKTMNADVICCGERAVDDEAAQVPSAIGEMMRIAVATGVEHIDFDPARSVLTARCRRESAIEFRELSLPCICSFIRGDHIPRYPSLDAIFDAGAKPVEYVAAPQPIAEPLLRRIALTAPDESRSGEMIYGEARDAMAVLLGKIAEKCDVHS